MDEVEPANSALLDEDLIHLPWKVPVKQPLSDMILAAQQSLKERLGV
jgi:hypothetical protein